MNSMSASRLDNSGNPSLPILTLAAVTHNTAQMCEAATPISRPRWSLLETLWLVSAGRHLQGAEGRALLVLGYLSHPWRKRWLHKSKWNIDETDSKQPKIHRKIHTSLWILKISRKKSANQKSHRLLPNLCDLHKNLWASLWILYFVIIISGNWAAALRPKWTKQHTGCNIYL